MTREKLLEVVKDIADLEPNWLDGEGHTFTQEQLLTTQKMIDLPLIIEKDYMIVPLPDKEIMFESFMPDYLDFTIDVDGLITAYDYNINPSIDYKGQALHIDEVEATIEESIARAGRIARTNV